MQLDRNALDRLLKLGDRQLMAIITKLAKDSGIDPAEFNINPNDISSIRRALSSASDEELNQIASRYESNKKNTSNTMRRKV